MKHFVMMRACQIRHISDTTTDLLAEMTVEVGRHYELREHSIATMIDDNCYVYVTVSAIFDERVK